VGWDPGGDVDGTHEVAPNRTTTICLDIMSKAGEKYPDRNALYTALGVCDSLFVLKAALERSPALSVDGFHAGIESLGTSFEAATPIPLRFGPGRHAGIAGVRYLAFDDGCHCFKYTSGVHLVN
jgi:hypothetical protein